HYFQIIASSNSELNDHCFHRDVDYYTGNILFVKFFSAV
ncbi:conserved domain protein, partial [delta proteobacterium NaphS2]